MFQIFTDFGNWLAYQLAGLSPASRGGQALQFFVEDVSKILVLLLVMVYVISLFRASLDVERVRDCLTRQRRGVGYLLASAFGAITPFCSCSSIPVFLGFVSAGIPLGMTMAFLLTSPLVNEVAVLMLVSLLGWKLTLAYVLSGILVGVAGGYLLDRIGAERWLVSFAAEALGQQAAAPASTPVAGRPALGLMARHRFALAETREIFGRVWIWVIVGVGLGAALHGFVPEQWIRDHLGGSQWWSVPVAVLLGLPLYSNATGIIPVMESLISQGLPVGTTMAFCMSTVAASFPEFILLKQVMRWHLLALIFGLLLVGFTLVGWFLNAVAPLLQG